MRAVRGGRVDASTRRRAREAALLLLARQLGDDELEVITLLTARVRAGQRRYGRLVLASDRRDFGREALEEITDALVYLGAELLRSLRRLHGGGG